MDLGEVLGFRKHVWIQEKCLDKMVVIGQERLGHSASVCVLLCWCRRLILQEMHAMSEEVLARPGEVLAWCWLAGWAV